MLILPMPSRRAILTALKAAMGLLDGNLVKLFQNDITPHQKSVVADFTEADFDGYAASAAIVWGSNFEDINDNAVMLGDVKSFIATGATTPNTIYGYWFESGGGALVAAERFPAPIAVVEAFDAVTVLPRFSFGQ